MNKGLLILLSLLLAGGGGLVCASETRQESMDLAQRLLLEAKALACPNDLAALIEIGTLQGKAKDLNGAEQSFNQVLEQIHSYSYLEETTSSRESHPPRIPSVYFLMLAEGQQEASQSEAAAQTLLLALKSLKSIKGHSEKNQNLKQILLLYITLDLYPDPKELFKEVFNEQSELKNPQRLDILLSLADAYNTVEYHEKATRLLEEVLNSLTTVDDPFLRSQLIAELAIGLIKSGQSTKGEEVLRQEFQRLGNIFKNDQPMFLREKVEALIKKATAYHSVGNDHAANHTIQEAEAIALGAFEKNSSTRSSILRDIALAKVQMDDLKGALSIEHKIVDEDYKNQSLPFIAEKMIQEGKYGEALEMAERIGKRDSPRKAFLLGEIGAEKALHGDLEGAWELASRLGAPAVYSIYRALGETMVKRQHNEDFLNFVRHQKVQSYQLYLLIGAAKGLVEHYS